jgi:plastocyanin
VTRLAVALLVAAATVGGMRTVGAGVPGAAEAAASPARLQVGADEFHYSLSRLRIKAGRVIVQLVNYGEDDHNLRLRRIGGTYTHRLGRSAPGTVGELRTRFGAGTFKLWCSLPGHQVAGMKATLRVVNP